MTKGAKIAIGCAIAAVLVVVIAVAAAIGFGMWGASKLKSAGFDPQKMARFAELQKQADAVPFTAPEDGVIPEDRFIRFLAVRKAVYPVYERHRPFLEENLRNKQKPGLETVTKIAGVSSDILVTRLEAMAAQGMGNAEYNWMLAAVYKTQIGAQVAEASRSEGEEGTAGLEQATEEQLAEAGVPPENLALFQKYRADIDQYAMPQLALLGL